MFEYAYDSADRLISATPKIAGGSAKKFEVGYDAQGRRIWKKVYAWSTSDSAWLLSEHRKFVYDGWNLVAEFLQDEQGFDRMARTFAWGAHDMGGGIGGLLAITTYEADGVTPASTYLPLFDGSGNVMGLFRERT